MAVFNYPVWIFEALLVLFTFALVVVGVLQWQTLSRTDDTLKATTRPWIDIDAKIVGPLEYSGAQITMLVQLGLKNSGHSPALNVRVFYKTLLVYDDTTAQKIQREVCESLSDGTSPF